MYRRSTSPSTTPTTRTAPSTPRVDAGQGVRVEAGRAATSTPRSMHDYRFKQMEYTLPEEYLDETELERQRKIHDSLITMGLKLISDSYLDPMPKRCAGGGAGVRAAHDGRQAPHRDRQGHPVRRLRPGRAGRARHRPRARQPDRLGLRARDAHAPSRDVWVVKHLPDEGRGRSATPSWSASTAARSPSARCMTAIDLARRFGKKVELIARLRPLPALLGLQRHRRRAHREGRQGLPLRGAEPAPRGDHRHRPGADLPVAPRGRRADGARTRASRSPRRCSTARRSRRCSTTRARPTPGCWSSAASASTARPTRPGSGSNTENLLRALPVRHPAHDPPRVSRARRAGPRRASAGRRRPRSA